MPPRSRWTFLIYAVHEPIRVGVPLSDGTPTPRWLWSERVDVHPSPAKRK